MNIGPLTCAGAIASSLGIGGVSADTNNSNSSERRKCATDAVNARRGFSSVTTKFALDMMLYSATGRPQRK